MAARERDGRGLALDDPPNSRLFILCPKGTTEQDFRDAFEQYGSIEDIWIIKDKRTNEDRGIAYIKYAKTSEAMQAMEEMNGKALSGSMKGLKVVVANSKREGSTRDPREDERLVRLFVIIPKHFNEQKLREEFGEFGEVDSVTVLKDHSTGENKGFGYVRYFKPLHAALAYENCDRSFRPMFAEPQRSRGERDEFENHGFSYNQGSAGQKRMYDDDYSRPGLLPEVFHGGPPPVLPTPRSGPMDLMSDYPTSSSCSRLIIQAPVGLTQGYLSKLFNLIPGMEYCDLNETTGIAYARYNSPQCASYARDKLNGFEYPLGSPLHVQFAEDSGRQEHPMNIDSTYSHSGYSSFGPPGLNAADTMDMRHKAAMILEKAGLNPHSLLNLGSGGSPGMGGLASIAGGNSGAGSVGDGRRDRGAFYCSIPLPPLQPTVLDDGNNLAQRLFIVCQPSGVSEKVLKDAFCRFGNLIDVYLLSGRNYGYAKYASKTSAKKAIETLHGQSIAGQKMKVLEAEPPKSHGGDEGPSKKQRL